MPTLRKLLTGATLAAGIVLIGAGRSDAMTVYCTNCSTVWDQLASYAKQVQQTITQLQSYVVQVQQYVNQIENTIALPMQIYSQVEGDYEQVRSLANIGSMFSGNSGSILTRLNSLNALSSYGGSVMNLPDQIGNQYSMWRQTIGSNLNSVGKMLDTQQSQQSTDAANLSTIESHSQGAVGAVQALQAGNELASANSKQLYQIEQTQMAAVQMQATQMAVDTDRQATQDEAQNKFMTTTQLSTSGGKRF